jgi:hypothetical protein
MRKFLVLLGAMLHHESVLIKTSTHDCRACTLNDLLHSRLPTEKVLTVHPQPRALQAKAKGSRTEDRTVNKKKTDRRESNMTRVGTGMLTIGNSISSSRAWGGGTVLPPGGRRGEEAGTARRGTCPLGLTMEGSGGARATRGEGEVEVDQEPCIASTHPPTSP